MKLYGNIIQALYSPFVVCNHADQCKRDDCPHRELHEKRNDCVPCDCFQENVNCS
jgi:hypothetical protein